MLREGKGITGKCPDKFRCLTGSSEIDCTNILCKCEEKGQKG